MATLIQPVAAWTEPAATTPKVSLWSKIEATLLRQKQNHTLWFFITLLVHGVLVLPVPAVLIYYFQAPDYVLAITMTCFFTNIIANMGGAGIKTTISVFLTSIAIHLFLILVFVL